LEFYRKALSVKIQVHGDDSQEIAIGLNNVGYALTETGQFDEALEKLEKARKILANTQMEKTAIWTHLLENLGDLHRSMGNFEDAEKQLLESFELRKKRFKEDLHHSYHNLGKLYRDTKEWEKAQSYFEKAIALRENRFKASTAQTLKEFAKLMQAMEKNAEATIMQQRAEGLLAKTE
jgi:tetratricopeptide (TPR) repeat protein